MPTVQTADIQLGAILHALGYSLARVTGPPERRVFVFENVPASAVASYHDDTVTVSPHRLFRSYRKLKRQL
jgi:hypothetical protein